MLRRIDWSDRVALAGVALGVLAVYLPWYGYDTSATHVSVNAFRASLLGDVFFVAIAIELLLVLARQGSIADVLGGRLADRSARFGIALTACGVVVVQFALIAAAGRSAAAGMLVAVIAVAALVAAAWLRGPDAEPRRTVREMLGEGLPD